MNSDFTSNNDRKFWTWWPKIKQVPPNLFSYINGESGNDDLYWDDLYWAVIDDNYLKISKE